MKLVDLTVLYLLIGVACAVALYRRDRDRGRAAWVSALTCVPLWPLLAPIAWTARRAPPELDARSEGAVEKIRAALDESVESVMGSPLERLLGREAAGRIVEEVERVALRQRELATLLARDEFSLVAAEQSVSQLERSDASPRARASARLHLGNVQRLHHLAARDARALEELSGLVSALRTQLLLVRLSGSSAEGVGDIMGELWARLQSLSEASDEAALSGAPYVEITA